MRAADLVGSKFNRLTVIAHAGVNRQSCHQWLCVCECGVQKTVAGIMLKSGHTKSCGCLQREKASASGKAKAIHGLSKTTEYISWRNMMARCHHPQHPRFADYGGRGIFVCKEWRDNFPEFLADMGHKPTPEHTIERIDNDGEYRKSNCRWATKAEQNQNTRVVCLFTFKGETLSLSEWARRIGTTATAVRHRLRNGWSIEDALTTPTNSPRSRGPKSKRQDVAK